MAYRPQRRWAPAAACAEGFCDQALVIDAASEYLDEVAGQQGMHARAAIGVFELPSGDAVEIEMMAAIRE